MPTAEEAADAQPVKRRMSLRRLTVRLAIIIVTTYAGVCALLFIFQSRLVYWPNAKYDLTPADVGLAFEPVTITTADGVKIAAWYAPHPQGRGTVLHCHGNARNMSDRVEDMLALHHMGYNVLLFDYRGYGASEGQPSE
jgi:predicted acyl esterase